MTSKQNAKLGDISNEELVNIATQQQNGVNVLGFNVKAIETGLKEVKQAVENSGTHIDFEGLEYRIETRVINQVKQITKHKKRIC